MNIDKDDITAFFGTVIIHLGCLILLYYSVLRAFVPLDDGGIPVTFGDFPPSTGMYQPPPASTPPQQQTPPQTPQRQTPQRQTPQRQTPQQQTPQQQTPQRQTTQRTATTTTPKTEAKPITQNRVETVSVPETKQQTPAVDDKAQKEREEVERLRREEAERLRREEESRKQQEAINSRVSGAFGSGSTQSASQGNTSTGTTNQGSPFSNSESGSNVGAGGFGSFNLNGRSIGAGGLPRPAYNEREEGRIVINITVDPNGNVILAEVGRGTNIDNATMRRSALDAAKRAKFNKIQGTNNQSGTITYNYRLN